MTRAPSTLPFALQPDPSPQEVKYEQMHSNQRYISSICRSGPLPTSSHRITDPVCMIIYLLILITTIILFCVNYFSGKIVNQVDFVSLNFMEKIMYGLNHSLVETLLSCASLIGFGVILVLLIIIIPYVAGYLTILLCFAVLGFIMYFLIVMDSSQVWNSTKISKKKDRMTEIFRISLLVIVGMAILAALYMNITRFKKLRHLWAMMGIAKVILMSNMPLLPLFMIFILSGFQIGLWCGFIKMMWNTVLMSYSYGLPISPTILLILQTIFWYMTYGLMFSISDYICQSWVVHWYYKGQIRNTTALKQRWKRAIFGKLLRFHFGTCVFGAIISAYLSDFFIWFIRFIANKFLSQPKISRKIYILSNYCYIQTVMQCLDFCPANEQLYKLRHRIKQKLPQVYMLGHFVQKTLQPTLTIATLYAWFAFSYKANRFYENNVVLDYSVIIFLLMCVVFTFGIFWMISLNISHLFGLISDTAVIVYSIDSQIQRVHFHQNDARSTPLELRKALRKLQIQITVIEQNPNNTNNIGGEAPYPYFENNNPNLYLYPRLSGNPGIAPGY